MSFGFGIGDIIAVSQLANKVRKRFVDSPDQFKAVADEVKSLSNVLRDLEDVLPERELTTQQQQDHQDHLRGCEKVLKDLDKIIDKYQKLDTNPVGFGKKSRRLWKRLKFEPEDVRDLRLRLISSMGLWNSFAGTLALQLSQSTKAGVDRLNAHQNQEHLHVVAEWLSSSDYPAQQNDLINRCQEGTGQWRLHSKEYQAWLDGTESTLFCPGIPGAGKTMITSIMINNLQQHFQSDNKVGIAYIYCNYKRQSEQTIHHLMASLLKQLIQQQSDLPDPASSLYSRHKKSQTRPSLDGISTTIRSVIHGLDRAFVVIDALDECSDMSNARSTLLKEVANLQTQRKICFFATSRFIPHIMASFKSALSLEIRATDRDLQRYVDGHISEMPACISRNPALQETVKAEIIKATSGMFLLARLHLARLSDKITAKQVKIALQDLPKGSSALQTAYAEAVERIRGQNSAFRRLAEAVLSWIVCAQRQLTILELRHALAVEDNSSRMDKDNFPDADEMVSVCAGMVTVDEESEIIRLVHCTMQEYLESSLDNWAPLAQFAIAKTCLTYLSFDVFKTGPCYSYADLDKRCQCNALFDYAARFWGQHFEITAEERIEQMALRFLDSENSLASSWEIVMGRGRSGLTSMHLTAVLGLGRLISILLTRGHMVDPKDSGGRTPLSYAAESGHEAVVRILLDQASIEADREDARGRTPLSYASSSGHVQAAKLLMKQKDVNINSTDQESWTPLLWAVSKGQEAIVTLLLERDDLQMCLGSDIDISPLLEATNWGHENIAKLLLQKDALQMYVKDRHGRIALHMAAIDGYERILRLLLERDKYQLNIKDLNGDTALTLAARGGNLATVKLLLEEDGISVNDQDKYRHMTTLMHAAFHGHEDIVRLMLGRNVIQVNNRCCYNWTALEYAATQGLNPIVKLLLEREEIDLCMNNETLENCQDSILELIEQAKDRRYGWKCLTTNEHDLCS